MRILILPLLLIGFSAQSLASPPVPQRKSDVVGNFDERINTHKKQKEKLESKADNIGEDIDKMQKKLVSLANSIQKNEKELQELDNNIAVLERDQAKLQEILEEDQAALADLILALQRIRRLPPEALLAKPDAPLETAQSAMLLQNTLPGLYEKAESLKVNLAKNDELSKDLKEKRARVASAAAKLQKEHASLSVLMKKREAVFRSTQDDIQETERETKKIASQAANLKDLVENLDEQRRRKETMALSQKAAAQTLKPPKAQGMPKPGGARLPISGIIKTRYNEPDHFGAPSQGMDIEGRGGALVVAPMGGIIRYAGAFKNYGMMVIIEHSGGYHSLVAGLEKVDTVVGQSVLAGEPLGLLHYARSQEKPVLYYELRYNGKAVDPARKFSNLS